MSNNDDLYDFPLPILIQKTKEYPTRYAAFDNQGIIFEYYRQDLVDTTELSPHPVHELAAGSWKMINYNYPHNGENGEDGYLIDGLYVEINRCLGLYKDGIDEYLLDCHFTAPIKGRPQTGFTRKYKSYSLALSDAIIYATMILETQQFWNHSIGGLDYMANYVPKLREKTVYSSLKPFDNYDSDFVFQQPKLGVLVRTGFHRGLSRQMADVYYETPSLASPGAGEIVEISQLDGFVRAKLIEIAEYCKAVGEELLENAKRLEEEACREGDLFDNLPDVDENDIGKNGDDDGDMIREGSTYDELREKAIDEEVEQRRNKPTKDYAPNPTPRRESTGKRGKQPIDYSALNEEDED